MKFRRQASEEVSVNLTPLIDVVFLLLIFFMVSTTFTKETRLQVDLPEAVEAGRVQETRSVQVAITKDGSYAIDNEVVNGNSRDILKATLQRMSNNDSTLPLVISADAKAPHESVVRIMEVAGSLGFSKLSIATREAAPK